MHGAKGKRGTYRAGFFFGTLSFGATLVLGFASTILTARLYGVSVVGDYALVWAPVAALWVLSTVKEQQALIKELADLAPGHPRVTQLFAAVFIFSTGLTVLVALLVALACCFVFPGPLDAPQLLAPALVSIAGYVARHQHWLEPRLDPLRLRRRQTALPRPPQRSGQLHRPRHLALVRNRTRSGRWSRRRSAPRRSPSSTAWSAARPFVRARLNREELRAGLRVLPALLRFGLKATPGQIAIGASQQGGIWAIGMVAPAAAVGAYSRAFLIPRNVQQASTKITDVLFPTLVGRRSGGDRHGFDRALIDSIRYEVVGMLLLAAAIGGAAEQVLDLFGPGFSPAAPALVLLLFFPVIASITQTQTQGLWAVDRPGLTSIVALAAPGGDGRPPRRADAVDELRRAGAGAAGRVAASPPASSASPSARHLAAPLRATWPLRERLALVARLRRRLRRRPRGRASAAGAGGAAAQPRSPAASPTSSLWSSPAESTSATGSGWGSWWRACGAARR